MHGRRPRSDPMADAQADIAAIIGAITHKMAVEQGVQVVRVPGAAGLRYRKPLPHPWPRAVELSVEILAADLASVATAAPILADTHETHRTSVFGCDVYADAEAIAAAGYDGCWNTALLAADLAQAPRTRAADLIIERVERDDQVAELNVLEPEFPSHTASLGRPEFVDLLGRRAGRAVAKGQIVCLAGEAAYVGDMFTHPEARNMGYAGAILSALHDEAAARGARRALLIPSQAAAESRFYEKRGYSLVCPRAVLLSQDYQ
jgi:GNAT superfamily N-acetyltransferase